MTLSEILVCLRQAATRATHFTTETALRDAADDLEAAVAAFDPSADLSGGMRLLTAAVAHAQRVYADATGKVLVTPQTVGERSIEPPRRRKLAVRTEPPEPPMAA